VSSSRRRKPYTRPYENPRIARERAAEHIRAAKRLSDLLGGTDEVVKRYLFSLSGSHLVSLLDNYEAEHGWLARDYAEETLPLWRSGTRKMAGQTAERFYRLLPQ